MSAWLDRYGPWAIVTGASDGIGRAIAVDLAARGMHLMLVARRQPVLEDLAASVPFKGVQTRVVAADLSDPCGVDAIRSASRSLDVGLLAACAGFGTSGPFASSDLAREEQMLDVNCRAVLQLTHHFSRRIIARGRGGVILMSSLVSFQGVPRAAHYAATKAYIQTFAEALRRELAAQGVDVVASAPGPVMSGFGHVAGMRITKGVLPSTVARGTLDALGRKGTVRPGWLSKALEASLATLPRPLRVHVLERVMSGMTQHQRASG